jgi:hypothetical protein
MGLVSDILRGWVTGLKRDLFRYWFKCWVKGYVRALEVRVIDMWSNK